MTNVLFLDIDGVLVPFVAPNKKRRPALPSPEAVSNLNRLIVQGNVSKVVVISDWARKTPHEKFAPMFESWGLVLPALSFIEHEPNVPRGRAIVDWVADNLPIGKIVVIDDEPSGLEEVYSDLVLTNPMRGITKNTLMFAAAKLVGMA